MNSAEQKQLILNSNEGITWTAFRVIIFLWITLSFCSFNHVFGSNLKIKNLSHLNTLTQHADSLFDHSYLHEIRLNFDQINYWDTLTTNYQAWVADQISDAIYTNATIEIDGDLLENVGARFKGLSSYYFIDGLKKPMKIDLNEFVEGQTYQGIKKFNLHNGAFDPSMMRDFLAYEVLRKAGVKVPRMSFAQLYINDEYFGVYGIIEQIDETFVEANFASKNGTLIKNIGWSELHWLGADSTAYQDDFELKMNDSPEGWATFINFLDVLNNTPEEDFAAELEKVFDVNLFLHVLASDVLLNNWDSYIDNKRNWYLYHEPVSGKMQWIPWDYNLCLGGTFETAGNPYPPIDPVCDLIMDFSVARDGDTFIFTEISNKETSGWYWNFGDGSISIEQDPAHTFEEEGIYNVCLIGEYIKSDGTLCQQQRCQKVDLSVDPTLCFTILAGFCPYPANDPIFQQVSNEYQHCCEEDWDGVCQEEYDELADQQTGSGSFDPDFDINYEENLPLIVNDTNKILINKILAIPEYREKYFNIVCVLLENNFTPERLFPIMDTQTDLIRSAIYEDPNYIYTFDYFEYDAGNGSGGGGEAAIPAIKSVLNQRFMEVSEDLADWDHNCSNAFPPVVWQEVVVNELMADNEEDSGILDPNGESDDWIELFNNTATEIDLSQFYLSDDSHDLLKWNFPIGTIISSEDYLVIWADKEEMQEGIHANFKLAKDGEALYFSHEDGTLVDSLHFGDQSTNLSFARNPNGIGDFVIQEPTFKTNNENPNSLSNKAEDTPFEVYPNPTEQFLYISFPSYQHGKTMIHFKNLMGQNVLSPMLMDLPKQRFDVSNLASGVYFLEIEMDGKIWVEKVVLK